MYQNKKNYFKKIIFDTNILKRSKNIKTNNFKLKKFKIKKKRSATHSKETLITRLETQLKLRSLKI